jgi:hypothetical protein
MFDYDFENKNVLGIWVHLPLTILISFLCFYKFIQVWRSSYMKKQLGIVRKMLRVLSVAPHATEQEYFNWKNSNLKQIELDVSAGPIFETVLILKRIKKMLGPEASAVLLLSFLNLCKDPISENPIGSRACRWARLIGRLPHLYACQYENIIMAKFIEPKENKENILLIMMYLCGPDCILTARMYLLFREGSKNLNYDFCKNKHSQLINTDDYHPHIVFPLPRIMSVLPGGFPSVLSLDIEYHNNRSLSAKTEWIEKVRKTRIMLWNESGVSLERILTLVGCTQLDSNFGCNMGSVLSHIGKYIPVEIDLERDNSYIDLTDEKACYICVEHYDRKKSECKHCFHKSCILDWFFYTFGKSCPICIAKLN